MIVSAFTPVTDVTRVVTPQLKLDLGESELLLIDLSAGKNRMGGSIFGQVYGQVQGPTPDVDVPAQPAAMFELAQELNRNGLLLACHDRSDGGQLT